MKPDHHIALSELAIVLDGIPSQSVDKACHLIANAKKLLLYGCGREGLQMRGFAMRLYHLGINASMVADMAAPPLGKGDLFIASAGPGELSTVTALMNVAKRDDADVLFFTATPEAKATALADHVVNIPAQTMANDQVLAMDQKGSKRSILPMGSIYEGAMFMLFEMMILQLQDKLKIDPGDMRSRHTNME